MKKSELVYREILFQVIEKNKANLTQSYIAKALNISLSTVNLALKPLVRMHSIIVKSRSFDIIDVKKILYYWASIRDLEKDIIYKTRVELPVAQIEKQMPNNIIFTAFTAYKIKYKDAPADYSEVFIYGTEEIKNRFGESRDPNPNLFVLKKDPLIDKYGKTVTIANLFVDLWNIKYWYAKYFSVALEEKIGRFLE